MPSVFLSPSTQYYNMYYDNSESEKYYMNLIADYMEPYLTASNISFGRNIGATSVGQSITMSNAGNYDYHLALHSNASGPGNEGRQTGTDVYYYPTSTQGRRAAEIVAENFKNIYRNPDRVRAISSSALTELRRVTAPTNLIEIAYHDNPEDAEWIKANLHTIAKNLAESVAIFLGVPFVDPGNGTSPTPPPPAPGTQQGVVRTQGSRLNIRNAPSLNAEIIGQIPNGAAVTITSTNGEWYGIIYNNINGYAFSQYIQLT